MTPEEERELIRQEKAKFPETFGLKAFPGKIFRIVESESYVSEGRVYLYIFIEAKPWPMAFAKGTPKELREQIA